MNNRGKLIIEATIVMSIIIFIVLSFVQEFIFINKTTDDYFNRVERKYTEIINEKIKEIRIEKAISDGK